MTTYCSDCKHVILNGKNDPSYRWLCGRHKRTQGAGFVTKEFWDGDAPYLYCAQVNGGLCELFEAKPEEQLDA